MRRLLSGCLGTIVIIVAGFFAYDRYSKYDFTRNSTQLSILRDYVPQSQCEDAHFKVLKTEDTWQDWLYIIRISDSKKCADSIMRALTAKGTPSTSPAFGENALVLPGHEDSEHESVSFDFDTEPGAVIWIRDKT